jgi:large subunit ribosomal protein L6
MSRKGKLPIPLPSGIEVKVSKNEISVKGPKGTLHAPLKAGIAVQVEKGHLNVKLEEQGDDQFHGLYRSLIHNMVIGTSKGFERKLEMIGVGYRASVQGHHLDLQIGYSHPTHLPIPQGLHVKVDKNTLISITGADKQLVGQFAATVRAVRPPEPYQGKGIRYEGEHVRRKAGKAAAAKK